MAPKKTETNLKNTVLLYCASNWFITRDSSFSDFNSLDKIAHMQFLKTQQCLEGRVVYDKKQFVHPQHMKRRWASERCQSDALGMDDVDIRHGTSVRPEQHVCPRAVHDPRVIANQPCIPSPAHTNTQIQIHKHTNTQLRAKHNLSHFLLTNPIPNDPIPIPNLYLPHQIPSHSILQSFNESIITSNHIVSARQVLWQVLWCWDQLRFIELMATGGNRRFVEKINCPRFLSSSRPV